MRWNNETFHVVVDGFFQRLRASRDKSDSQQRMAFSSGFREQKGIVVSVSAYLGALEVVFAV